MTEEEALERVSEIGSAFANDLNDGDNNVLYEGADVTWRQGHAFLTYSATIADDDSTKVEFRWLLLPVTPESEKEILGEG